jgi:hypothetical protein
MKGWKEGGVQAAEEAEEVVEDEEQEDSGNTFIEQL